MPTISDEQDDRIRLIRESVATLVPRDGAAKRARALRWKAPGYDRSLWREMARAGWIGLRVPEESGGAGLGMAEFCAIAEGLGAALRPEPFVTCAATAPLLEGEDLGQILGGDGLVMPAWQEVATGLDWIGETRFLAGRVTGIKHFVPGALSADSFLVTTRDGLALVRRDAPGVSVVARKTHDGSELGEVHFADAPGKAVAGDFGRSFDEAALATAAYLLGALESAFEITLSYLSLRKQFGHPIGSFQALQHRVVDLKIKLEITRAVVAEAAAVLDTGASDDSRRSVVSRAKARASDTAIAMARETIQFHGAIGMTDEHDIGLYARKILATYNQYGPATAHRRRFTALSIPQPARH
jgi:alkylation response protein AidB-like acyl-CoA dehydrogenase